MSDDIGPILKEWDDDPDSENIRKIVGSDGREKIQIRVQFGLLQIEADGRPDGKKAYGKESFLEHFLDLLEEYREENETDEGFGLDYHDCEKLHEEALQYYHRYVSFFELGDYQRAQRDTDRNLRVLDLVRKHAENEDDSQSLEKYRPYITMMNARAKAFIHMDDKDYAEAISIVNAAIDKITDFYRQNEIDDSQIEKSQELAILKVTAKEIRDKWEGH
jgi:tetratricopeptide (TPR) repeat protein